MDESVTITKITVDNEPYYLKVSWIDNIDFVLVNRDRYWTGVLSKDEVIFFCSALNMTEKNYIKSIKEALSSDRTAGDFNITFSDDKLIWSKIIGPTDFKMKYGVVNMTDYSSNGGTRLISDEFLKLQSILKNELYSKNDEINSILEQLAGLKKLLQESMEVKEKMENDLYARFLAVLNSKKQKVSEYEEFLKDLDKNVIRGKRIPALKPSNNNFESDTE